MVHASFLIHEGLFNCRKTKEKTDFPRQKLLGIVFSQSRHGEKGLVYATTTHLFNLSGGGPFLFGRLLVVFVGVVVLMFPIRITTMATPPLKQPAKGDFLVEGVGAIVEFLLFLR